jgi:hypothetical protein
MRKLLDSIKTSCDAFFEESNLHFHLIDPNKSIISGDNLTPALDNYKNAKKQINVLKWFADFWIYIEIRRIPNENQFPFLFISISVFQGKQDDPDKKSAF